MPTLISFLKLTLQCVHGQLRACVLGAIFLLGTMLWLLMGSVLPATANGQCTANQATIPTTPIVLNMAEDSGSDQFALFLCTKPTHPVTVTFAISPTNQITITPLQLTLDTTNTVTVMVNTIDDEIAENNHLVIITPKASSKDKTYDQIDMVRISVTIRDDERRLSLPIIQKPPLTPTPTPTPTPLPQWQRVSNGAHFVDTVAIHQSGLFLGDRRASNSGGGIYRADLANQACRQLPLNFGTTPLRAAIILDFAFREPRGLAAAFTDRTFASADNGLSWQPRNSGIDPSAYAVLFGTTANVAFAGTDEGVYRSTTSGESWTILKNSPKDVNTLYRRDNQIWVGTFRHGVLRFDGDSATPTFSPVGNLTGGASEVWQILFDGANNRYYLATSAGVYQGDGSGTWQPLGLQNVYSLEVANNYLYAGLNGGGVQRAPLAQLTNWLPVSNGTGWRTDFIVRDLLYDPTNCNGLLAATNEGLWVLRE